MITRAPLKVLNACSFGLDSEIKPRLTQRKERYGPRLPAQSGVRVVGVLRRVTLVVSASLVIGATWYSLAYACFGPTSAREAI